MHQTQLSGLYTAWQKAYNISTDGDPPLRWIDTLHRSPTAPIGLDLAHRLPMPGTPGSNSIGEARRRLP